MPKLRDFLASDLPTFFNPDEFAEMHDFDGRQVLAVVDSDILKIRSNDKSEQYDGVYKGEVAVYVKAADLPARPVFGQQMRLDGKLYLVVECSEAMGVLEIVLGANES
jgi:hypothetical protein